MVQEIKPNTKAAIKFLKRWRPEGPWVLTSVIPDGAIYTETFAAADWNKCADWIDQHQGHRNMYFHVNPVRRHLTSKATKEDMESMSWLHIDIDPRVGEDFEEERKRALSMLQNFSPRPTVIIDSGGGYQGFWKLIPCEELMVRGSVEKAQELEAYNIQLEMLFSADHCHNIDRIMRLPGTVNIPNARKLKKGRKPATAKLIEWNDNEYRLGEFTPAVRVQNSIEPGTLAGTPKISITGNVPVVGVEELQEWARTNSATISDHCYALIATGEDPLDPTKYPSRSEALFRVCCELTRAEVPPEMIYAVITGPNEIASSVLEKKNYESYALRQIERAQEEAVDPALRQLNEKHAVIADIGGKCRIISEVWDAAMKRFRISKQSFEDFRNRYRHIKVQIGTNEKGQPIEKPAGAFWIDHPQRRQYETITFAPGQEVKDAYNLWKGFACDAIPGKNHLPFLEHTLNVVCSGNKAYYDYLVGWMAYTVQHMDGPGEVAVVMRGKRGTGKSFFAKEFGALVGRHFLQISNSKHLVGSFNAHLRDTVILFGDEAFFAGDKRHESVLKTLVTEEHLIVEGKGVDAEAAPNYVHILLASNDDWVVPAGLDERRFFVLEVSAGKKRDFDYFRHLRETLDQGGRENLLSYLLTYDLSTFEIRNVPQTEALQEQKILSMSPETQWMFDKLWDGRILRNETTWRGKVIKDHLYDDYINEMRDQGRNFRMNRTSFWKFLSRSMPDGGLTSKQEVVTVPFTNEHGFEVEIKKRMYVCYFPDLYEIREFWDKNMGGPFPWPQFVDDQGELEEYPGVSERPF